jgi:hypothetical protein
VAPGAGHARRLAEQVVEKDIGRAGRLRAGIIADNRVEAEQGLDDVGAEIAAQDLAGALGEEVEQQALLFQALPAEAAAELEEREQVGQAAAALGGARSSQDCRTRMTLVRSAE